MSDREQTYKRRILAEMQGCMKVFVSFSHFPVTPNLSFHKTGKSTVKRAGINERVREKKRSRE